MLKSIDKRALLSTNARRGRFVIISAGRVTRGHHVREFLTQRAKFLKSRVYSSELGGDRTPELRGCVTRPGALSERRQLLDFGQRKPESLRSTYEAHLIHHFGIELTVSARAPCRRRDQTACLIE